MRTLVGKNDHRLKLHAVALDVADHRALADFHFGVRIFDLLMIDVLMKPVPQESDAPPLQNVDVSAAHPSTRRNPRTVKMKSRAATLDVAENLLEPQFVAVIIREWNIIDRQVERCPTRRIAAGRMVRR